MGSIDPMIVSFGGAPGSMRPPTGLGGPMGSSMGPFTFGQRSGDSSQAPGMPGRQKLIPQPVLDSAPEDGPVSIAVDVQPRLVAIRPKRPCPDTKQYLHRWESGAMENRMLPRHITDICGWVQASIEADGHSELNANDKELMNVKHNEDRVVYMATSGWALQMWRSKADFDRGISPQLRGSQPRPLAWWDMRRAFDVVVDVGNINLDDFPHRLTINMTAGNVYFRIEYPEDVATWYYAIRRIIHDASKQRIDARDTPHHQEKRWPAAVGLARAISHGQPIGSRAMAITFHAYDIDYDCCIQVGEIMVLITELQAAKLFLEGRAEAKTREAAIYSVRSRITEEDIFEAAMHFRYTADPDGNGKVCKDEFIRCGQEAICECFELSSTSLCDGAERDYYDDPVQMSAEQQGSCAMM